MLAQAHVAAPDRARSPAARRIAPPLAEPGDRSALAEEARIAEQYGGTLSGGMDQAIALLACEDHALRIDFRRHALPARVDPA